ncbi:hypothetical protein AYL99_12004 [Fonsecaea erecta]|uniref:Uncharacterized protein n=1 Tax=Fonsecaea erecta TaxID=1367422 RepID=A0A178Z3W0_9EURO|nr:hypothetical protein AYL99_12004 [Fonsecaea erecta]OAP53785.1 hypothetical protein AYL99_12004 [Fonsecaea erecta]
MPLWKEYDAFETGLNKIHVERMKKIREPYDKLLHALYNLIKKVSLREKQDIQKVDLVAAGNGGDGSEEDDINASNVAARKAALDSDVVELLKYTQDNTPVHDRENDGLRNLVSDYLDCHIKKIAGDVKLAELLENIDLVKDFLPKLSKP